MSLINQMLKDLEQRNAAADDMKPTGGEVRTVNVDKPSSGGGRLILALVVLAAVLAGAWWQLKTVTHQVAPQVVAPPPAPVAVVPPAAPLPPAPSVEQGPAVIAPTEPVVAEVLQPMPRLPGLETELKSAVGKELAEPVPEISEKKTEPKRGGTVVSEAPPEVPTEKSKPRRAAKPLPASPSAPLKSVSPQQKSDNLYKQSVTLLQQGRVAEARDGLLQSLTENPLNHNARQLLVGLLVDTRRLGEATGVLQEGVRLSPDQTGFVMALARLQVEAGDRQAAMQTLEQGAKFAEAEGEYQGFYAALLQREGRHDEAVAHYLKALGTDPANTSWLVGIGISLQASNKPADAREAFERARQSGQLTPELQSFVEQRLNQLKGK